MSKPKSKPLREKKNKQPTQVAKLVPRSGYVVRYCADPEKSSDVLSYEVAAEAARILTKQLKGQDVRIRVRRRPAGFQAVVKVAKEVKAHVATADLPAQGAGFKPLSA